MATKDAATLLSKDFVAVKLDTGRSKAAKDIAKRYADKEQSLPWFAFLDGDARCLIHSIRPNGGNIGHPAAPDEVEYFRMMLQKVKKHLTDDEIKSLVQSLEAFNRAEGIQPPSAH